MKVQIRGRKYNGGCGDGSSALAAAWLGPRLGNYGAALEVIEFQPHYRSSGGPRKSLERMYQTYHHHLATLPGITYRRSKKTVEIRYECRLLSAEEVESDPSNKARRFQGALAEMAAVLELLREKLRPADGIDVDALLTDLRRVLREAPTTEDELEEFRRSWDAVGASIARTRTDEDERTRRARPKGRTRPLKGLRIYHGFGRLALRPYDFILAEILSNLLRRNGVRLSGYDEIYIQLDHSLEEARRKHALQTWHRYTYGELDFTRFRPSDEAEKIRLLLASVRQGLHHIADLEGLDRGAIDRSLDAVERHGIGLRLTWTEGETALYHARLAYQVVPFQKPTTFTLRIVEKSSGKVAEGTLFRCPYEPDCLTYLLGKMSMSGRSIRFVRRNSLRAKVWLQDFKVVGDLEARIQDFLKKHPVTDSSLDA